MTSKQYSTNMLQAGDTFVVVGRTSYPRLTRVLDGDELQEEIKRCTQQGRIPISTPHSSTTLVDAAIEYANPQAPTMAELYAAERIYLNKDGKQCYNAIRKGQTLADYGVVNPTDYTKVDGIYLDPNKVLANGLLVKCYFRVYDTKAGMNKGISLDSIVFQEPVKYYEFSNAGSQLAARGLTWTPPVGEAPVYNAPAYSNTSQTQPAAPVYGAPTPAYGQTQPAAPVYGQTQPAAPAPAPAYVPPMPAPASQDVYSGNTAPAPAYGAPAPAPAYGAPAPAYGTPAPAPAYGTPAPAPTPAPQQQIGNAGGSAFDSAYQY